MKYIKIKYFLNIKIKNINGFDKWMIYFFNCFKQN